MRWTLITWGRWCLSDFCYKFTIFFFGIGKYLVGDTLRLCWYPVLPQIFTLNLSTYQWPLPAVIIILMFTSSDLECIYTGVFGLMDTYFTLWIITQYYSDSSFALIVPAVAPGNPFRRGPCLIIVGLLLFWVLPCFLAQDFQAQLDFPYSSPRISHFSEEPYDPKTFWHKPLTGPPPAHGTS